MKVYRPLWVAVAALVLLPVRTAQAGYQYQSTIVAETTQNGNTTDFKLTKPGSSKVVIKPSSKSGDGGTVIQMVLTGVDCPAEGNDGAKTGKCGNAGSPVMDHVLELGVRALGIEFPGGGVSPSAVGILFKIAKGTAVFEATGKNILPGKVFGPSTTSVFNSPLGIGLLRLHTPGSVTSDCATAPPGPGCTDGVVYAYTGIVVGSDSSLSCSGDTSCSVTQTCQSGACVTQSCSSAAQCRSGHCDNTGKCCDPNLTPATCP